MKGSNNKMKKGLKQAVVGLMVLPLMVIGITAAAQVGGYNIAGASGMTLSEGVSNSKGDGVPGELTGTDGVFEVVVNVLLFIIGAVSVIMLIYGGIRYTTSGGNANSVTAAKNTIMYSIIGLVVAILAYAIVNFVVKQIME